MGTEPSGEPSGVDLAKAALAAARAKAREQDSARRERKDAKRIGAGRRSAAGPDDRDPQPLGSAMNRLITERGWETPAAVGGVIGRWSEVVGAAIAEHCTPEEFTEGVLSVRVDSPTWATELRYLAPQLLVKLNRELGMREKGAITRIQVLPPAGTPGRTGRFRAR